MCGFAGFVEPGRLTRDAGEAVTRRMTETLRHRGPDDEGFWRDETLGVHLGFRRLSILDLSEAGHQPMTSTSGRFVIVFNGEVYNFREMRAELADEGWTFRGHSDTEVLLAAFERWGPVDAVGRFRGMFAFALWDSVERTLWLARDRVGIKPLYVARRGGALVFGSELRALLEHPAVERTGSRAAGRHYSRFLVVPAPLSILEGVEKVMPGTMVRFTIDSSGVESREDVTYWRLPEISRRVEPWSGDQESAFDHLHQLLRESVRLRLVADVPVGALLSGGVDSSLVVALMSEQMHRPVKTFTIRFDDPRFDEGPMAEEVATRLGADHTSVELPSSRIRDLIPELGSIVDEPMANPSLLPTLLVCQVARRQVVVALSGDGGDELFGGYNRYRHVPPLIRHSRRLPRALRLLLGASARAMAAAPTEALGRLIQPRELGSQHSLAARLERVAGILGAGSELEAYEAALAVGHPRPPMEVTAPSSRWVERPFFASHSAALPERMMLLDQVEYLPDDLLAKVDRASMWTSLEARVPLLDHRIVEFSWRLPFHMKVRDGVSKLPLRALAGRYLPDHLLDRPKMGFTVPIDSWLRTDLSDWLDEALSSRRVEEHGLYESAAVSRLARQFRRGRRGIALRLWTIAVLEEWAEKNRVTFR